MKRFISLVLAISVAMTMGIGMFTATAAEATVSTDKSVYTVGEQIDISYANLDGYSNTWLAIYYGPSSARSDYSAGSGAWQQESYTGVSAQYIYVSGSGTMPFNTTDATVLSAAGLTNGAVADSDTSNALVYRVTSPNENSIPLKAGQYHAVVLGGSSWYDEIAVADFTIVNVGSEQSPDVVDANDTITVPAGETYYCTYNARGGNWDVTVTGTTGFDLSYNMGRGNWSTAVSDTEGAITEVVSVMMGGGVQFKVTNNTETEQTYTLAIAEHIVVAPENELVIGENTITTLAEYEGGEITVELTITEGMGDGIFTITMSDANTSEWMFALNNNTANVYGDQNYSDGDILTDSVACSVGDVVSVKVVAFDGGWNPIDGSVLFTTTYEPIPGTEANPIIITAEDTITVPAGETYYFTYQAIGEGSYLVTVNGATGFAISANLGGGNWSAIVNDTEGEISEIIANVSRVGVQFKLTNSTDTEQSYTVTVEPYDPLGSATNPETLTMGEKTLTGLMTYVGYCYTYTATEAGTLTFTFSEAECSDGYYCIIDGEDVTSATVTVDLEANDTIEINIDTGTYDGDGVVVFTAAFEPAPAAPSISVNKTTFTVGENITVNYANSTNAGSGFDWVAIYAEGSTPGNGDSAMYGYVTGTGVIVFNDVDNNDSTGRTSVSTAVTPDAAPWNNTSYIYVNQAGEPLSALAAGNYKIYLLDDAGYSSVEGVTPIDIVIATPSLDDAAGTEDDPKTLVIGDNVAESDGLTYVYFTYTATETGKLSITMSTATGWEYQVNELSPTSTNLTTSVYVQEGDVVTVKVTAYENWAMTAGTVAFTATFAEGETQPIERDEYKVDFDTQLVVGDNVVTLLLDAVTTIYEFSPDETGEYTITAPVDALIGHWGANANYPMDLTANKTNTLVVEIINVGNSAMIGITGIENGHVTIEKTGTVYTPVHTSEDYENTCDIVDFTEEIAEDDVIWIDVTVTEGHDIYEDPTTGLFHYGSEDGPIILVNLINNEYGLDFSTMINTSNIPVYKEVSENGDTHTIYARDALIEYLDACNEDGFYPLTKDLLNIIQGMGDVEGWFTEYSYFFADIYDQLNHDYAHYFICGYVEAVEEGPTSTPTTTPTEAPTEAPIVPGTGDAGITAFVVIALAAVAVVAITFVMKKKSSDEA